MSTSAVPLPLVSFDVPGSPREETRSYDGSLSRFGSPHAAPALSDAPEIGRSVTQPTSELLARIAELERLIAVEVEDAAHARRLYGDELAVTARLIKQSISDCTFYESELRRLRAECQSEKQWAMAWAARSDTLLAQAMALKAANAQLQAENASLKSVNVRRLCALVALDVPDTEVMDPADWYADDTQTPRVDAETMAETVGGGR